MSKAEETAALLLEIFEKPGPDPARWRKGRLSPAVRIAATEDPLAGPGYDTPESRFKPVTGHCPRQIFMWWEDGEPVVRLWRNVRPEPPPVLVRYRPTFTPAAESDATLPTQGTVPSGQEAPEELTPGPTVARKPDEGSTRLRLAVTDLPGLMPSPRSAALVTASVLAAREVAADVEAWGNALSVPASNRQARQGEADALRAYADEAEAVLGALVEPWLADALAVAAPAVEPPFPSVPAVMRGTARLGIT